ncbi:MAG: dinitrogenase iron-molybdenum cofactor biosynthesis protein [Planctomycetes bacterium]|nr:dinitrogenase iron-molybdenum cofactor biosynthesis protein [Planctomycetota bacterium]
MKIAMPVWQNRLSPVFDASRTLCVVCVNESGEEEGREKVSLQVGSFAERVRTLVELDVDVLICGAISAPLADMVASAGIRYVPFVAGEVEAVLKAFSHDELYSKAFVMPGCSGHRRRHRRGRKNNS